MAPGLTKADLKFMSRGTRRKAVRDMALAVDRADRCPPTSETVARLIPDPIAVMLAMGLIDIPTKDAALELADVYVAVYGAQMPGARGAGGHPSISNAMAWIHTHRYLPWARRWSGIRLRTLPLQPAVIDLVVLGQGVAMTEIAGALKDYAGIRRDNPMPKADDLAREVG